MTLVLRGLFYLWRGAAGLRTWSLNRFTRGGWLLVAGLFLTTLFSMPIRLSVAYQTSTLLASLLLVALAASAFARGRFAVRRNLPRYGSAGESLVYPCEVQNLSSHRQERLMVFEIPERAPLSFEEFAARMKRSWRSRNSFRLEAPSPSELTVYPRAQPLPDLAPRQSAEAQLEFRPACRGVLRFSGIAVVRAERFNLVRRVWKVDLPAKVLVLPRRYPVGPVPLPGTVKYQPGGVAQASSVGESLEFVSLRDYRRGDPLRHIHWRSWARTGRLIVKEFEDEFFVRHALILDTFTDPAGGEIFEEAVSVAASFACTIQTQESLLDLLFVESRAYCFTTGRGLAHPEQMLEVLAAVQPCAGQSFDVLQSLVIRHLKVVTGCIAIFTAWDAPRQELARRIRAAGVPLLVCVITRAGQATALDPGPLRDQPQAFRPLESGKIAEGLRNLGD